MSGLSPPERNQTTWGKKYLVTLMDKKKNINYWNPNKVQNST